MKRSRLLVLIAGIALVGAAVAIWVTLANRPSGGTVAAAEPNDLAARAKKIAAALPPSYYLLDVGYKKTVDPFRYWVEREVIPGEAEPQYSIRVQFIDAPDSLKLSEQQVIDFLKLHDQVKGQERSDSEIFDRSAVVWHAGTWEFQLALPGKVWRLNGEADAELSTKTLEKLLKDIETMKKAKPSIKW